MVGGLHREVRYKGLPFMIEVEDKGQQRACIVTKIFFRGSLVVQEETSYADILKFERLEDVLRKLVFELYRKTYKDLQSGKYDQKIKELLIHLKEADSKIDKKGQFRTSLMEFIEKRVLPEIADAYADRYTANKIWEAVKNSSLSSYNDLPDREKFILLCRDIFAYLPTRIADDERDDRIMNWIKELTGHEKDNGRNNT